MSACRRNRRALPAPAFRRPEAACGDRPRADAQAETDRVRRGGRGTGYVHSRRRAQSVCRIAARPRPHLRLHHPRSRRGLAHQRARRGDVSRPFRRVGPDEQCPNTRCIPIPRRCCPPSRCRCPQACVRPAHRAARRGSEPDRPALGMPFSHPLPLRARPLRRKTPDWRQLKPDHWVACHFAGHPNFSPN